MSWPGWNPAAAPIPTAVAPGPVQSTLLPAAINSAPTVLPPTLTQYSPEQWAQAQQQNWQQWAQWQQQYQQWHQQYGAEYQKSLTAMQTAVQPTHPPLPAVATPTMAPPLPVEPKPPLPPEEPPSQPNPYMTMPLKPMQTGYSTAPPTLLPQSQPLIPPQDPYGQRQEWQQNASQKRPYSQEHPYEPSKKPNLDKGSNKWGAQVPPNHWPAGNQNFNQPPPQAAVAVPQTKATNVEELSEAEKKFDKEFAAWEAQFNKWKEQNANHPDKVQYKEYEKKWESWRNSLLERREQMRKKRVALTATKNQQNIYNQAPPTPNQLATGPQGVPVGQGMPPTPGHLPPANQTNFSIPPPNQNNEPLTFKNNNYPHHDDSTTGTGFLTSTPSVGGGIPGLDLVKDEGKDLEAEAVKKQNIIELDKEEQPPQAGRPDLDAISKGINTILGDQKLLSMLSMVTQKPPPAPIQNQGYPHARSNYGGSDIGIGNMSIPPPSVGPFPNQPSNIQAYNDQSNQSYEERSTQDDYYAQREDVTNFDDQTRSSFTLGPGDQDQGFRNRGGPPGRFSGDRVSNFGPGRNNFGPGNQRFPPDNFGGGGRTDRYGGPRNVPDNNFSSKNKLDSFGRSNFGSVSSEYDRFGGNRGNDRFSEDNFEDDFQNENEAFGKVRNENRDARDQFNNRSGDYNKDNDYDDYDNYNEEEDYDKYHNMFIEDDQDFQDDYKDNNFQRGNRDFQQNRDYPPNQKRDFPSSQRDFAPNQRDFPPNRDFPSNQKRGFSQNRDFPPPMDRDFPPPMNRDFPPPMDRDFPPPMDRDFPPPMDRDFQQNLNKEPLQNENTENIEPEIQQPLIEDKIFEPTIVIDYEHKSLKKDEPNVAIEPFHMFDYNHKPLNRVPNSQRPEWLFECVKFIREFDPEVARMFDKFPERSERYLGRGHSYDEDPHTFERGDRYERDDRFNREREGRFNRDMEDRYSKDDRYDRNGRFERNFDRDEFMDDDRNRRLRDDHHGQYDTRHNMDDYKSTVDKRNTNNRPERNIKESLEDLSEDEMEWDSGERNKHSGINKSRSNSPLLSNPPNPVTKEITTIEDIINPPGRFNRPPRIVIILRGPPGSGKTHLAKLIKDKEVEQGGSTPRILSLDDYFMIEQEKEVFEDGKMTKVKEMVYEYEAEMEESYRTSFIKSFKKTITDGYFPFIIVDNVNDKVKYFGEMWSFAKQNGFQVYICQMDLDPIQCTRRNIHNRTEAEIEECIAAWEPTPNHHPTIDASAFLQNNAITEVEMEVVEQKPPEVEESDAGPELNSMESTNRLENPEPWKNTFNRRNDGNQRFQPNRGRRGFGGPTWRSRSNWRR